MYYRTYTCISDLIHVLQSIYLFYGSYSCAKVPVGTMSRNRSGSYHIQGQIRLLQIRTLVFRRYRSQIHYTEVTVVTTGLILIRISRRSYRVSSYVELTLITDVCSFGTPVGVTEFILIQNL